MSLDLSRAAAKAAASQPASPAPWDMSAATTTVHDESSNPLDVIMNVVKDVGDNIGVGMGETGKFFASAGTAVGDGVMATGSLVATGFDATLETLPVIGGAVVSAGTATATATANALDWIVGSPSKAKDDVDDDGRTQQKVSFAPVPMAPLTTETKEPLHPVAKFFSQLFGAFCMLPCKEAALEDRVTVRDRTRAPP